MQDIPRKQILARLALENTWWEPPHEVPPQFRKWPPRPYIELFLPLVRNLAIQRAPVLMGPRRVGKTFLLHHCIEKLLAEGVPPRRLCYISVDTPTFVNQTLETFLDLYQEAAGQPLSAEPVYFFFDEIQYLWSWEQHLKSLVDTYPHVRFVVSGSAAAALKLQSQESGAGRFTDFLLPPLTFYEYLELVGAPDLVESSLSRGVALYGELDLDALNERFESYIRFGGYPEAALSAEIQASPERFIKSDIIEKVLLRDIPSIYGIANVQELNALFTSLAYSTARECSLVQISQRAGVTGPTIKKYIEYLQAAFLIHVVHRVDRSARYFKRQRQFKVYLTNPSLRTALFGAVEPDDRDYGHLVETAIFAQWFHYEKQRLHYANWKRGEVDLVNLEPGSRWAAEVKWSDRPFRAPKLIQGAVDFCVRNGIGSLAVTTRTLTDTQRMRGVAVTFWPAALYAYAVGHSIINYRVRGLGIAPAP